MAPLLIRQPIEDHPGQPVALLDLWLNVGESVERRQRVLLLSTGQPGWTGRRHIA